MNKLGIAALAFGAGLVVSAAGRAAPPLLGSTSLTWEQIEASGNSTTGLSRRFFENPTATLAELEMHVTHLPPGKSPHAPHTHPEEELVIIKEGTLEAMQAGKTRRIGPGGVIFQASNQLHGVKNVGETPATYYVVRWASPGMPRSRPVSRDAGAPPAPARKP
jgi:XRE family transcriptional regulator, regulator of sulfur utilization